MSIGDVFSVAADKVTDYNLGKKAAGDATRYDLRTYRKKDQYDWAAAQSRGLTPQEFYGSPAAGGQGSNAGQVLGNGINAGAIQQATLQSKQMQIQSQTQKDVAQIQADAQKYTADKQAGATTRGQDLTFEAVMQRLKFDKEVYRDVTLPQAGRIAKKTRKEIEHLTNVVATSEPKFVKMLKIMSMGTDNTLGLAIQNSLGIDVSDIEQMQNLSDEKRLALIQGMMTAGSTFAKELSGAQTSTNRYLDLFVEGLEQAAKGFVERFTPGIQEKINLGNGNSNRSTRNPGVYNREYHNPHR